MFFNTLITTQSSKNSAKKNSNIRESRNKYISDRYNERSIINRYFK